MDNSVVVNALYERFITPTKKKREKYIGVEIEMPIVNLGAQAVDFSVVHKLTKAFSSQFQMDAAGIDDEGHAYSLQNIKTGDNFSYDCSYNNLEISFGKEQNINVLHARFKTYYSFIENFLHPFNYTLTGMGVNPYRKVNHCVPIPNERYRMLFHYLGLYKSYKHPDYFHPYPDFGTFSSASQVQIDVDYSDVADTINVFSKLEPIKSLLFSNSTMPEDENGLLCVRDMLWENSMQGLNPKNVGFIDKELTCVADLFEYIQQTSIYCIIRNGKYIDFTPIPVLEYFKKAEITGEFWNGSAYETTVFKPQVDDLQYLRTFKFEDLTYRGTIEFRSCCCQPIADSMTVAAFHAGLCETLDELKELINSDRTLYGHGMTASELRRAFNRGEIPEFVNREDLQYLIFTILALARKGLEKRGFDEAHFLEPLFNRTLQKTNPALEYLSGLSNGVPVNELVQRYAKIV